MHYLQILLFLVAASAVLLIALVGSQLRRSDPAGNGLAQVWMLGTLALAWLLVLLAVVVALVGEPHGAPPSGWSWSTHTWSTAVALPIAFACQLRALGHVFAPRERGTYRRVLLLGAVVVPAAFLLDAAHRNFALPLPQPATFHGCAGCVLLFSLLPWAKGQGRAARRPVRGS